MTRDVTVTFADGTTHTYAGTPDNVTPDLVELRAEKEYKKKVVHLDGGKQPAAEEPLHFDIVEAAANYPASLAKSAIGLANMVIHPADTMQGLIQLGSGALSKVLPSDVGIPAKRAEAEAITNQIVTPVVEAFKGTPGARQKVLTALEEDPAAVLGFGSLAPSVAKTALRASSRLAGPGRTADVLSGAAKVADVTEKVMNPIVPLTSLGLQGLGNVGTGIARVGASFFPSGQAAIKSRGYVNAFNGNLDKMSQAIDMLQQGVRIEDIAVALNSPGFASFAKTSQDANTLVKELWLARAEQLKALQTNQLAGAAEDVNALRQANLPVSTASATQPRRDINLSLAERQAALEADRAAATAQLTAAQQAAQTTLLQEQQAQAAAMPKVSQRKVGLTIKEERDLAAKNAAQNIVSPAYEKAFTAHEAPFSFEAVEEAAKRLTSDPATRLNPQIAPYTAEALKLYAGKTTSDPLILSGAKLPQPALVTLRDADKFMQAINSDLSALEGSVDATSRLTRKNLMELKTATQKAIDEGVPQNAADLYKEARTLHRTKTVEPFLEGWIANLEREGATGENLVRSVNVAKEIIKDEDTAMRFVAAVGDSPKAMSAAKQGIVDLYRKAVFDPKTKTFNPDAHAKFMEDNSLQLKTLDDAGMGVASELNKIGAKTGKLKATEELLTAEGKAIPAKLKAKFAEQDATLAFEVKKLKYDTVNDLRSAALKDPLVLDMALSRMSQPARDAFARGFMQDASEAIKLGKPVAGEKMLSYIVDNEAQLLKILRASNPKTAAKIIADAKESAKLYTLIEQVGNKLSLTQPVNTLATSNRINTLTSSGKIRDTVEKIRKELETNDAFDLLAAEGKKAGADSSMLLSTEVGAHPTGFFGKAWSIGNLIRSRMTGAIDSKLAAQIGTELAKEDTAAKALSKAKLREEKIRSVTTPAKAVIGVTKKVLRSPAGVLGYQVNNLAPQQQNQNALAQ